MIMDEAMKQGLQLDKANMKNALDAIYEGETEIRKTQQLCLDAESTYRTLNDLSTPPVNPLMNLPELDKKETKTKEMIRVTISMENRSIDIIDLTFRLLNHLKTDKTKIIELPYIQKHFSSVLQLKLRGNTPEWAWKIMWDHYMTYKVVTQSKLAKRTMRITMEEEEFWTELNKLSEKVQLLASMPEELGKMKEELAKSLHKKIYGTSRVRLDVAQLKEEKEKADLIIGISTLLKELTEFADKIAV